MARLEDKINEIKDTELRRVIAGEVRELKDLLTEKRRFGLVFENHQPELVPIFSKAVRARLSVAKKSGNLAETWRVLRVKDGIADLERDGDDGKIETEQASVDGLVVVRRTGEPIYPALVPVGDVSRGKPGDSHHILIEADNFHALQLLEYVYRGKVDCIYIDPPYNTGARDWKYNNDYVDGKDAWRHSKWLTFMLKRLRLAKRLLNPDTGILIVTIDEHEVQHLGCLLEQEFPEARRQMVTIVNNGAGVSQGGFYRVEEYAYFCFFGNARPTPGADDLLSDLGSGLVTPYWFSLIRYGGINALPSKRAGLVYPIAIDPDTCQIAGTGKTMRARLEGGEISGSLDEWRPDSGETVNSHPVVWPYRGNGQLSTWQLSPEKLIELAREGFVRVRPQKNGPGGNKWSINYVKSGNQKKVREGVIPVLGRDENGAYILGETNRHVIPKTVWRRARHDAGKWGSRSLREILGDVGFDYAKSPYAVLDCISTAVGEKTDALIVDFFSGSGTTLQATTLLNDRDGGNRQCILVTNNEVTEADAQALTTQGLHPGSDEWEAHGICQSVTWPRSKFTINGQRDDGTPLPGDYLTGRMVTKEKARTVKQLAFADGRTLPLQQRKQLAGLIVGVPQSKIEAEVAWFLDDDSPVSVLWDATQAEGWLEAIAEADHVGIFYVVTQETRLFNQIKAHVLDALPPMAYEEEERRPLAQGFDANLAYFKLDFLDPNELQMGRQLAAILPILWMMAGARGPRPEAPSPHAPWLIPEGCPFVVLLQETRAKDFMRHVVQRTDLTHVFIVTNARDLYQKLRGEFEGPQVVQLYKDYLENFKINLSRD